MGAVGHLGAGRPAQVRDGQILPHGARKVGPICRHKLKYQIIALDGEFVAGADSRAAKERSHREPSPTTTNGAQRAGWA
jgi:hypothetical protein